MAAVVLLGGCTSLMATPTPERISDEIRTQGAGRVVHRLWENGDYRQVLDGISAGDSKWIALAPALAAGTDAASSEGLSLALARALPKNPAAVLSVLQPDRGAVSAPRVCGLPFIEGDIIDVADYRRSAIAAVAKVEGDSLKDAKAACLVGLNQL